MASDLFTIGTSGIKAARAALDITAQNIANASTEGYVRRSVRLSELSTAGGYNRLSDISLSGVRVDGIVRNADLFRQAEVRRTGSDAARAGAELAGLENAEAALEQSNLYPALTSFESSLQRLAADPVDPSLRAAVLEDARTLTRTFNIAAQGLDEAAKGLRFEAQDGTAQVNLLAGELARTNLQLMRASPGTSDQATLLDQRDSRLGRLSQFTDVSASINANQTVDVRLGGNAGPLLVSAGNTAPFAMATASDGTISFTLGGGPVALSAGSLAGKAQALVSLRDTATSLDTLADSLIAAANGAQAGGAALDGSPGQPLFSGSGAAGIGLALTSGSGIATAPAGAGAGSRDGANLSALRSALDGADISGGASGLLFSASSAVAGRRVTADALEAIASSARIALDSQSGVDLEQEAVNLVRFQKAFQASGRAIQVASDIFDTLLALK
ncbi:MAG: flagellar hook-associated protein FlgK [Novosphingobium sp.]|nr:flagellar hook-associated protein FlgK [Novosphingobium sp.]